ncbi:thymidine kinase [Indivirus ILV1]|uniref:Thymidine kinase n=1 Tax=Indivirus ILV1 TaxID=1977633 RepID=A0A1V0SCY0_9VIRU|nr:thymidine kinase [Indivirus ILV1]
MSIKFNGQFNLIIAGMFAGKSTELIRRYNRYTIGGKKCIMIKWINDDRYDSKMVVTHDNIKVDAIVCRYLFEADGIIKNYDVVCIDEVQFYKDAHIFCDKWANENKIVEACGLNGTFNRQPFPIISLLIPLAENITFMTAICKETGKQAAYSQLNIDTVNVNKETNELIGGIEMYSASDRQTYFKSHTDNHLLSDFLKFYADIHGYKDVNINQTLNFDSNVDFKRLGDEFIKLYKLE